MKFRGKCEKCRWSCTGWNKKSLRALLRNKGFTWVSENSSQRNVLLLVYIFELVFFTTILVMFLLRECFIYNLTIWVEIWIIVDFVHIIKAKNWLMNFRILFVISNNKQKLFSNLYLRIFKFSRYLKIVLDF